jgi:hypothetical protein
MEIIIGIIEEKWPLVITYLSVDARIILNWILQK